MGIYVKQQGQSWTSKKIAGNPIGDAALDKTSSNNIQNGVVATKIEDIESDISGLSAATNAKAAKSDAIKNITRSGTTFTATRADNTTFTFTQQDNYCGYSSAIISRNIGTTSGLFENLPSSVGNNLNNITWNSEYNGSSMTNAPNANWGFVVTRCHANGAHWARQDFYDMFDDAVYTRRKADGNWGGWTKIGPTSDFTYRGNPKGGSINIGTNWYEMIIMVRNDGNYVSFATAHILKQSLPNSGWFYPRLKTAFAEGNVAVNQSTVAENDTVFSSIHIYTR